MECTAPIRAQANMATTSSTIMGIYIATRSPFLIPENIEEGNIVKVIQVYTVKKFS